MSNGTALAVRDDVRALDRTDRYEERASIAPSMTFESLVAMGDQLVGTGFLPKHIRNGAQAAAVILAGQELGMKPMRALRSLQLVEGKVVEAADSQLSRFHADGGKSVWKRLDEQAAVLWLRHPNGSEHEETFTIDDAQRAGLLGKDNWKKYPKAMLRSRTITAALKSIGWEGGVGAYDPEEAQAFMPAPGSAQAAPSTSSAPVDKDPAMTVEDALAYPLPGKPTAWRGNGGKPLGELSKKMIPAVREWIHKIITEQEEKDSVSVPVNYELRKACDLILAVRGSQAQQESEAKPAASGAENPTTLAPGRVEDALVPKTTAHPKTAPAPAAKDDPFAEKPSLTELTKRLNKLLSHQKLTDDERNDFLARSSSAKDTVDLMRLVLEAEELINSPI